LLNFFNSCRAILRRSYTLFKTFGKSSFLTYGKDLHVGRGARLWAPNNLIIGDFVYIGNLVHIEADAQIGNFCLIANRVAIIGRYDHDFSALGFPIRFSPWVGSKRFPRKYDNQVAIIEDDVWLGYASIVLTGVTIGRGCVVAAGSVVTNNIPPYSIAAGVPARVIGSRFSDSESITIHESAIRNGKFEFSEQDFDHCVIEPNFLDIKKHNYR